MNGDENVPMLFASNCADGTVSLSAHALDNNSVNGRTQEGIAEAIKGNQLDVKQEDADDEDREASDADPLQIARGKIQGLYEKLKERDQEMQRMRIDYDARVHRCAELRDMLEERDAELAGLKPKVEAQLLSERAESTAESSALKAQLADAKAELDRTHMCYEDRLAHSARLLQAHVKEIKFLDQRVNQTQAKYETMVNAKEPIADSVVEATLREKDKAMSALTNDVREQEKQIACLNNDLKSVLDFMMRVNIESAGGPSESLTDDDFLPSEIVEHLGFSIFGTRHVKNLYLKYQRCMEETKAKATASIPSSNERKSGDANNFTGGALGGGSAANVLSHQVADVDSSPASVSSSPIPTGAAPSNASSTAPKANTKSLSSRKGPKSLTDFLFRPSARKAPSQVEPAGRLLERVRQQQEVPRESEQDETEGKTLAEVVANVEIAEEHGGNQDSVAEIAEEHGGNQDSAESIEEERAAISSAATRPSHSAATTGSALNPLSWLLDVAGEDENDDDSDESVQEEFSPTNLKHACVGPRDKAQDPSESVLAEREEVKGLADRSPTSNFDEEAQLLQHQVEAEKAHIAHLCAQPPPELAPDIHGQLEILRAAFQGDVTTLETVLSQVPDSNIDESLLLGWTVCHAAASEGHQEVLNFWCENSARKESLENVTSLSGLSPLGIACICGHVESVRFLLKAGVSLQIRDVRGNGALHWAAAGVSVHATVPLLLEARVDPSSKNQFGQSVDLVSLLRCWKDPASQAVAQKKKPFDVRGASHGATSSRSNEQTLNPVIHEPYHLIRAGRTQPREPDSGLLSYAYNMLATKARDGVEFAKNDRAKLLAQLTADERASGVWSDWCLNYTHAGLLNALDSSKPGAAPTLADKNRQALVLTCERVLLFHVSSWSLVQVVGLRQVSEVLISSWSDTVFVCRGKGTSDIVLDMPSRDRFLDELRSAKTRILEEDDEEVDDAAVLPVRFASDQIMPLFQEKGAVVGTLAFVEKSTLLLVPHAPKSLLLQGETFFFGLLELHRSTQRAQGSGVKWRWQVYVFILKSGMSLEARELMWCHHPSESECAGSVAIGDVNQVQSIDTPQGDACLIVSFLNRESGVEDAITLRARSPESRDDWVVSIRTMQERARDGPY